MARRKSWATANNSPLRRSTRLNPGSQAESSTTSASSVTPSSSTTPASSATPAAPARSPSPDSSSDIEFLAIRASGEESPTLPAKEKRRREVLSDDDEVQFVSAGRYTTNVTATTADGRKRRSVITGTFVQTGPPVEGWDNVELWDISDDEDELDSDTSGAGAGAGASGRNGGSSGSGSSAQGRARRTRATVSYVEAELDDDDDESDFEIQSIASSDGEYTGSGEGLTQRQLEKRRERQRRQEQQKRAEENRRQRREERKRAEDERRKKDQRIIQRPIYSHYPLDEARIPVWFPAATKQPLKIARRSGDKSTRFSAYAEAYGYLRTIKIPETVPQFLRGWVIYAIDQHPLPTVMSVAAKFGATVQIGGQPAGAPNGGGRAIIEGAPVNGPQRLQVGKFHKGSTNCPTAVSGSYKVVTGLCVMTMIDTMLMRLLNEAGAEEEQVNAMGA